MVNAGKGREWGVGVGVEGGELGRFSQSDLLLSEGLSLKSLDLNQHDEWQSIIWKEMPLHNLLTKQRRDGLSTSGRNLLFRKKNS